MFETVIRPAVLADVEKIVRLSNDGGPDGKPKAILPQVLPDGYFQAFQRIDSDPKNALMVVEHNGIVIGTFHVTYLTYLAGAGREDCQVEAVHVDRAWRGKGIGTKMMEWAISQARKRGCRRVQLTTNKQRVDAHRFYQSLGFSLSHEGAKLPIIDEIRKVRDQLASEVD